MRERDVEIRRVSGEQRRDAFLVLGVGIGMEQAHGNALDAAGLELLREALDLAFIERHLDLAVRARAFLDAEAPRAWDQHDPRLGLAGVDLLAEVTPDLEHVLEARRRDQRALGQAPLQDGIRRDGGAMEECGDIAEGEADLLTRHAQARDQPLGGIGGRCRRLGGEGLARRLVQDLDVGECTADIDGNAHGAARCCRLHLDFGTSIGLAPQSRRAPFCREDFAEGNTARTARA